MTVLSVVLSAVVSVARPLCRASLVGLFATVCLAARTVWIPPAGAVEVLEVRSPGGIAAWLIEDHATPIVTLSLGLRGAAALDPPGKAGLATLVASTIDEGAGDLDSRAFQRRLSDLSITLRFSAGADVFRGSLRTLTRHRQDAFDLLGLALTAPRFDPEPVTRVRTQLQESLRRRTEDADHAAYRAYFEAVFAGHPYARPGDGSIESLDAIGVADLRRFVAERLTRDRLVIGVAGDIDAATLGPLLDRAFAALPASGSAATLPEATVAAGGQTIRVEKDAAQAAILFGQPGPRRDDPDFYAAFVLNHILGGPGLTSRLYQEVREKRGLAYDVGSFLSPLDAGALWMGRLGTDNATVADALAIVRSEWRKMQQDGVTETELADAITHLTGAFPLRFANTAGLASMLVDMQLDDLGIDYIDRRNDYIRAVGLDDMRRVAATFDPDALTVVIVGRLDDQTD